MNLYQKPYVLFNKEYLKYYSAIHLKDIPFRYSKSPWKYQQCKYNYLTIFSELFTNL